MLTWLNIGSSLLRRLINKYLETILRKYSLSLFNNVPKHVQKQTKIIVGFPRPLRQLHTSSLASVTTCVTSHERVVQTIFWTDCIENLLTQASATIQSTRTLARKSSTGVLCFCAGGLDVCAGGAWHSNLTKIPLIYNVSYFSLGELDALFGGLSPPKPPTWRRDYNQHNKFRAYARTHTVL